MTSTIASIIPESITNMAQSVLGNGNGVHKIANGVNGQQEIKKHEDLARDMKDYNDPSYRITSDYGVKQTNTGGSLTSINVFILPPS
jgi:hypothetical protein